MEVRLGQALMPVGGVRPVRLVQGSSGQPPRVEADEPRAGAALLDREPPRDLRAGFGKDTITPPGAAVSALGQGLRTARQVVPQLVEMAQEQRQRRAEEGRADQEAGTARRPEQRRLEAAPQAANFVNGLGGAANAQAPGGPSPPGNGQTAAAGGVRQTDRRLDVRG